MMLGKKRYVLIRDGGSYVEGVWKPQVVHCAIYGSLQPLTGRNAKERNEIERQGGTHVFYTKKRMLVSGDLGEFGQRTSGDVLRVSCSGGEVKELRAIKKEDWTIHTTGIPHWRVVLGEIGVNGQ